MKNPEKKIKVIKLLFVINTVLLCSQMIYANNKSGTDKIGMYIGYPLGFSFSHNFTQKDQLDIQASGIIGFPIKGNSAYLYYGGDFYIGYLRSVAEPNVNGSVCPFEIGGGISLAAVKEQTYPNSSCNFAVYIGGFFDLRWEVFFINAPYLNLFLDISPGVYFNTTARRHSRHSLHNRYLAILTGRAGLGLRYVF